MPLATDVRTVRARYGSSVASYFAFYRWIVGLYLLLSLPAAAWLIARLADDSSNGGWGPDNLVGLIPGFLAFSNTPTGQRRPYVLVVSGIMATQLAVALRKWAAEDRVKQELALLGQDQLGQRFSRAFLAAWDNGSWQPFEVEDARSSHALEAAALLADDSAAQRRAARTLQERVLLHLRRGTGMAVYLALLLAAWASIVYLTSKSTEMGEALEATVVQVGWLSSAGPVLASSIVPAAVAVINAIMPVLIKTITRFERWDSERFVTYLLTMRMYLAKILNAFLQALSYMLLANPYLLSREQFRGLRSSVEQSFSAASYECRADQAAAGLWQLVLTEVRERREMRGFALCGCPVTKYWGRIGQAPRPILNCNVCSLSLCLWLLPLAYCVPHSNSDATPASHPLLVAAPLSLAQFVASKFILMLVPHALRLASHLQGQPHVKAEFEVAKSLVGLLYFQALLLAAFPLFPLGIVFGAALLYSSFKFEKRLLLRHHSKPKRPWRAQDAGSVFVRFYLATLLLLGLPTTYYVMTSQTFPKQCAIQDASVGLCSGSDGNGVPVALAANETCTMDAASVWYEEFSGECSVGGYPACICAGALACGPFMEAASAFATVDEWLRSLSII
ncbi:unnamed protein product, partial [Phaeothamnion confervicola]